MKRRYIFSSVFLLILVVFVTFAFGAEFWGSKNSNKYHYPTCRWAQKIKSSNLIKFSSPEEAVNAGYVPCKVCKPPLPSKSSITNNTDLAKAQTIHSEARRGCCSWHGGVCGCDETTGRVICCDGTLSPTCT